jgi:hypothetical protein
VACSGQKKMLGWSGVGASPRSEPRYADRRATNVNVVKPLKLQRSLQFYPRPEQAVLGVVVMKDVMKLSGHTMDASPYLEKLCPEHTSKKCVPALYLKQKSNWCGILKTSW